MADIRILLNDRAINDLQPPASGQYRARDTQLKGFHVVVGRRSKVFAVQGDLRKDGKRVSSISVRIGDTETMSTREARATAKTYLAQISKGEHPSPKPEPIAPAATDAPPPGTEGEVPSEPLQNPIPKGVTLRVAWERYRDAHLIRKGRSEGTVEGYRDHVERLFKDWLDTPLQDLAEDPGKVIARHDEITKEHGPYIANGSMRTLRAIYNHARKAHRYLPPDNPASVVDWNPEERRKTGMGLDDLPHAKSRRFPPNPARVPSLLPPFRMPANGTHGSEAATPRPPSPRPAHPAPKRRRRPGLRHSAIAPDDPLPDARDALCPLLLSPGRSRLAVHRR
ncbi:integrase arm-type DNA-binding domain-containing protein [Mesorhizobium muleiense]|uniref:integrase arm-type DNA-binding domain-containing protein n=1 Tax=Mesorhizobium muleiense TaxID=1004279 RepID=UPI003AFB2019